MNKFNLGVEIGAGIPETSFLLKNKDKFNTIQIIEPNFIFNELLRPYNSNTCAIIDNPISDITGNSLFYNHGLGSFLASSNHFLSAYDDFEKAYSSIGRPCKTLSIKELDKGNIDFLSLTCNGSELVIIENLISHPEQIRMTFYMHHQRHFEYFHKTNNTIRNLGYTPMVMSQNKLATFLELLYVKN